MPALGRRRLLRAAVGAVGVVTAGCIGGGGASSAPIDQPESVPNYTIAEKEDLSFSTSDTGKVVRLAYSGRTSPDVAELSKEQIRAVGADVVIDATSDQAVCAMSVDLFADSVDIGDGACGQAIWAPGGEFSRAKEVDPGNYDSFELVVGRNEYFCNPPKGY